MDERIRNLMRERGHQQLLLTVEDPDLGPKLLQAMETLVLEDEAIRESIGRTVVSNLKSMSKMATFLEEEVQTTYPEFPLRKGVLSWEDNLPPLSKELIELVDRYDTATTAVAAAR